MSEAQVYYLHDIVATVGTSLAKIGIAKDVSARSLRSGEAMALLLAGLDKDTIKLVGRWRSDGIFSYLHAQTLPLVQPLARKMLQSGNFTLMPGGITPQAAEHLLAMVPTEPGQPYYREIAPEEEEESPN